MKSNLPLKIFGVIFLLWGVFHTAFQIQLYGVDQGVFFWFCNLALLLTGIFILIENKNGVIALLSTLILTQSWLFVDMVVRAVRGTDLFGLTESFYHPGISLAQFFSTQYHLFLIPTLCLAFFLLENKRRLSSQWTLAIFLVIAPVSYFLFPPEQNINCLHAPCFGELEHFKGKGYSILFPLVVLGLSLLLSRFLSLNLVIPGLSEKKKTMAWKIYGVTLALLGVIVVLGAIHKKKIPFFTCAPPTENADVKIQCRFTTEYIKDWFVLTYRLTNKTDRLRECSSFIEANGKKELFQDALFLEPLNHSDISILMHYPQTTSEIRLTAECQ